MLVILEGPRGVGKTRLAEQLKERAEQDGFQCEVKKFERGDDPTRDMMSQLVALSRELTENPGKLIVIDRFHLTELVMRLSEGTIDSAQVIAETGMINSLLCHIEHRVVIMLADEKTLNWRIAHRGDSRGHECASALANWSHVAEVIRESTKTSAIIVTDSNNDTNEAVCNFVLATHLTNFLKRMATGMEGGL